MVVCALAGAGGAFGLSMLVTPTYESSASLYFSLRAGDSGSDINQGSTYTQNQMLSFAELASSSMVLSRVARDLGGGLTVAELRRDVTATTPQNTVILNVGTTTVSRTLSAEIANSVASNLTHVVDDIAPVDSAGKSTVTAHVIEPAVPAKFQSAPDKKKNAVLGAGLGAVLSILGFFLAIVLDTRVRSVTAVRMVTDRPVLGIAERTKPDPDDARPIVLRTPAGSAAERYRQIRAGLNFAAASHEMKLISITSSIPHEGKTLTSLNLALTLAESKERILLIDADLRRPRIADYLGFEGAIGLTTVLVGEVPFNEAVQRFGTTTLDVLTAGEVPPNPAELLASKPMRELIDTARADYDLVIVDTAPLLSVADAAVIAQQTDTTVVVADSSKLRQVQLEQTLDSLESVGAYVAGIILNRVRPKSRHDSYYREYHIETKVRPGLRRSRLKLAFMGAEARRHAAEGSE